MSPKGRPSAANRASAAPARTTRAGRTANGPRGLATAAATTSDPDKPVANSPHSDRDPRRRRPTGQPGPYEPGTPANAVAAEQAVPTTPEGGSPARAYRPGDILAVLNPDLPPEKTQAYRDGRWTPRTPGTR
jgi:hypothetical protein